ncbi:hypothetical protein [Aureivirga sp. CE67]|uniref:hypothetical protein n=1 Tax=Aureivirga sp. CE67 TaxID=1788983 RepID=UPI0018C8DEB4|nr:hypothetical protein [Aureivirga sp. CE67]
MNVIKNNIIFHVFFAVVVFMPSSIQLLHALDKEHLHEVCTAKDIKHIHNEDVDCSVFHTIIDFLEFPDFNFELEEIAIIFNKQKFYFNQENFRIFYITKKSRAPPMT